MVVNGGRTGQSGTDSDMLGSGFILTPPPGRLAGERRVRLKHDPGHARRYRSSVILELILLLAVAAAVLAALAAARRARRRRELAEWQVAIRTVPHATIVELVRPGEHSQRIARLDPAAEDFSTLLEEARYAAMERAVALNVAREGLNP